MVTLDFTWVGPGQVSLTSAVDQQDQYREIGFAIVDELRNTGYTVERSSNGTTAGAGDNIASKADIVFGLSGSQNHSWALMRASATKGNPSDVAGQCFIIDFVNSNVDTTPQSVSFYVGVGTVSVNGDVQNRAQVANETTARTLNMVPWTTPVGGSICRWRNDNEDAYVGVKQNGVASFKFILGLLSDPDNANGNNTLISFSASATGDAVTGSLMSSSSIYKNLQDNGTNNNPPVAGVSTMFNVDWPSGAEDVSGDIFWRDVELIGDTVTAGANRYLGLMRDIRGLPTNAPFNVIDDNDDGASAPFELRGIGAIAIPCDSAIA